MDTRNEFTPRKAHFHMIPNFAFCGKSGSGKTYSALLFARGYVGNGKICVIDTENRRSETYANDPLIGDFDIIELTAPFTPERYLNAYRAACDHVGNNGFVIIDSGSHEWEGEGGTLEFAESINNKTAGKWNAPKQRRKKFVQAIANPIVPTIICFRVKDRLIDVRDPNKGTVEEIVTEKNFKFELTTIVKFQENTHFTEFMKAPKPLRSIVKNGVIVTPEMGAQYAHLIKSGSGETSIEVIFNKIQSASTEQELNDIYKLYQSHSEKDNIINACKARKANLNQPEIDPETGEIIPQA